MANVVKGDRNISSKNQNLSVSKDIPAKKKTCFFCDNNKEPSFKDSAVLRRFMSDRSRINTRQRSGNCSKHQRELTSQLKYARHLALLPFITRV